VIPYKEITNLQGDKATLEFRFTSRNKKLGNVVIQLQTEEDYKTVLDKATAFCKEATQRVSSNQLVHSGSMAAGIAQMTEIDQSLSETLTADDWKLILDKSKQRFFDKNQVVIRQGDKSDQNLYQLAQGRCRVEQQRPEDDTYQALGFMNAGETFGEISFLQNSQITASVVADEDKVEIYVIEGDYLNEIFNDHPAIPGRFYKYLATLISNRLHHREMEILS